ncbi:MAG: hypothetical protein SFX73_40485 [Kofleriaceae bacterium]|nr:hypothetical protein [Kofleriaceae bacterium]
MRTMFTALLVVTVGCSEDTSPPQRALSVTWNQGDGCVVRETCFAGASCTPAAPYETECSQEMAKVTYAKLADGTCRLLPSGCTSSGCLGDMTECPPLAMELPTVRWSVERKPEGPTCNAIPQPRTALSPKREAIEISCETYQGVSMIAKGHESCFGFTVAECPEPATCQPSGGGVELWCPRK